MERRKASKSPMLLPLKKVGGNKMVEYYARNLYSAKRIAKKKNYYVTTVCLAGKGTMIKGGKRRFSAAKKFR